MINHISRRCLTAFFALSILFWSNLAGAVLVFDNATDYTNAVGAELFYIDFNGSPGTTVDGSTIDPNAVFSSPEASDPSLVVWNSDAITDTGSTTASNNVGPVAIDFVSTGVFGFSFYSSSSGELQTIELYDNSNSLIGSVLSPSNGGFFGFVSDIAIGSVIVRPGAYAENTYDRFFIDDLRANAASVPEPGSLLLMGLGLAGLGLFRRYKCR